MPKPIAKGVIRSTRERAFGWIRFPLPGWGAGDAIALLAVTVAVYAGVRLALGAPALIRATEISLSRSVLPMYAGLSLLRMLVAYVLSVMFSLVYGRAAARSRKAEAFLIPLLDVLQSVPILSFLPVVLLSFSAFLPQYAAAELASIVLIFTSQVWNLTFAWYQAQKTIPLELREAAAVFGFGRWRRFKTLDLPFAAISFIWNSLMSWSGGWFFLMAAEIFTVGNRDFRLPGLGAYLSEAANRGDVSAIAWGLGTLIGLILALDQFVWRPLLAWSDRFKLESTEGEAAPGSWFLAFWRRSALISRILGGLIEPAVRAADRRMANLLEGAASQNGAERRRRWRPMFLASAGAVLLIYGLVRTAQMLAAVPAQGWQEIWIGLAATGGRVLLAMAIAALWTTPVGVIIGSRPAVAAWLQPLAQIAASVPATALFPVLLLALIGLPWGLNMAAVLVMLMGTQWYLLFNVIAGARAIPQDLKYTTALLGLSRRQRWRTLILPALFPYLITGLITAGGGAWNASIVAEYAAFAGQVHSVVGIGSVISHATAAGDYPVLLAATLVMIFAVVLINLVVWRRLYSLAEERFRMD